MPAVCACARPACRAPRPLAQRFRAFLPPAAPRVPARRRVVSAARGPCRGSARAHARRARALPPRARTCRTSRGRGCAREGGRSPPVGVCSRSVCEGTASLVRMLPILKMCCTARCLKPAHALPSVPDAISILVRLRAHETNDHVAPARAARLAVARRRGSLHLSSVCSHATSNLTHPRSFS
jgi:hypothetical protein